MERSLLIASIVAIGVLFICSGIAVSDHLDYSNHIKKYILCGYAYGYTDTSPPSEILNQSELVNRCKNV